MNISIGPKLSEQKNPVDYIVPPPTSEVGTIIVHGYHVTYSETAIDFSGEEIDWSI